MATLTDNYSWMIGFARQSGECGYADQIHNNTCTRSARVDPNDPPSSLGAPFIILLLPQKPHLPAHSWRIPEGATPVYAFLRRFEGAKELGRTIHIGHAINGRRYIREIDPETGTHRDTEDADPRARSG